jgi:3-oxoacyl-[acyl-carrier-protein] synthase-1
MMSSLGFTLEEHRERLKANQSGIKLLNTEQGNLFVSSIDETRLNEYRNKWNVPTTYSRLEAMSIISIEEVLLNSGVQSRSDLQLFIASTKGNIDHIHRYDFEPTDQLHLISTAKKIRSHFEMTRMPITVCNACTSGLMAIIMACRLVQAGHLNRAVVCGVDILSDFTMRGFAALHAMDVKPCQPFDVMRDGITLGEACASVLISADKGQASIEFLGGGSSNDANHISGPSRTGEGLKQAITQAMKSSHSPRISYINAHGTATKYNDEMEAQAFHALGMSHIPAHSLKGYWGHTLGAAGVLETVGSAIAMQTNTVYTSIGYESHGLTLPFNVARTNQYLPIAYGLKTSSGFGGSNAALVLKSC